MATQTEGTNLADLIKYELPRNLSRSLVPSEALTWAVGEIFEYDATSEQIQKLTTAASAGGVVLDAGAVSAGDLVRVLDFGAVVDYSQLDYNSIDEQDTDDALRKIGIKVLREATVPS